MSLVEEAIARLTASRLFYTGALLRTWYRTGLCDFCGGTYALEQPQCAIPNYGLVLSLGDELKTDHNWFEDRQKWCDEERHDASDELGYNFVYYIEVQKDGYGDERGDTGGTPRAPKVLFD